MVLKANAIRRESHIYIYIYVNIYVQFFHLFPIENK